MVQNLNQTAKVILVHGYIKNELGARIANLIGPYQTEEIYMEGGYELTVAMTGNHSPRFLHGLYDCLLLNDYFNTPDESYIAFPENGFEKLFNIHLNIKDLPEGNELLENFVDERAEFIFMAVLGGYDKTGRKKYLDL